MTTTEPRTSFEEMVAEMAQQDLVRAQRERAASGIGAVESRLSQ